ncbi:WecB/TagA/CpsF family glycosyltransferase [Priestia koreensis]|uniref:WecB/TagA/CpsF family glycosyltransferase n=1 Tax=Priestia koreensis TaxID=284581 RepID=UPI003457BC04
MQKETYLGVDVSPLNYEEIITDLRGRMAKGEKSTIIAVNPEKMIKAETDADLKQLINESTYQIPDGIGVLLASKLKKGGIRSRVTGVDMMDRLLRFAAEEGKRVFFYGAKEEVVRAAKENIEKKYPTIQIVGYENGYEKDNDKIVRHIQEVNADLVFVAMGSPRQEHWIRENMHHVPATVFQGVGGSFDVYAGHVKRAPEFFQKLGLEWFYRLITQPSRFKRQLALPRFLLKILFSK